MKFYFGHDFRNFGGYTRMVSRSTKLENRCFIPKTAIYGTVKYAEQTFIGESAKSSLKGSYTSGSVKIDNVRSLCSLDEIRVAHLRYGE